MVSNCKKMFWNNQSRLDYVEHLQSLESGTEVGGGAHTMSSIQTGRLWSIFTADDINMEVFILSRRVPFCPEKRNANKSFFAQTEESSGNWDSPLKTTHCTWKERCYERNNLPSAAEDLNIDIPIYIISYPCLPMAGCQRWTFSYLATLPHYWNASNPGDQFWSLIVLRWYRYKYIHVIIS